MMTKLATKFGLSLLALGLAVAPAMAAMTETAPTKAMSPDKSMSSEKSMSHAKTMSHANTMGHAKTMGHKGGMASPDSMADQLNAQSLAASQSGKEFMAPGAGTPAAAPAMKKKM